jgi:hypothetical protein
MTSITSPLSELGPEFDFLLEPKPRIREVEEEPPGEGERGGLCNGTIEKGMEELSVRGGPQGMFDRVGREGEGGRQEAGDLGDFFRFKASFNWSAVTSKLKSRSCRTQKRKRQTKRMLAMEAGEMSGGGRTHKGEQLLTAGIVLAFCFALTPSSFSFFSFSSRSLAPLASRSLASLTSCSFRSLACLCFSSFAFLISSSGGGWKMESM